MMHTLRYPALAILVMPAILLSGCATFSTDGGMTTVSTLTRERIAHPVQRQAAVPSADTQAAIATLLAAPLTPDTAVQIALLNNRNLQASLVELGVAEADLVQAGRLRNPGFSFGRQRAGDDVEIERSVLFDLGGLVTMPMRRQIESRRFAQAQLQAASQAVQLAADIRKAYFHAVASQQSVRYAEQVVSAADAGAELAQRMKRIGNFSKLDQAREQIFYAEAIAQLARAQHNAVAAHEELTRLLGLLGDTKFQLPERLPELPTSPNAIGKIEALAMQQRLDVQMAKRDTEATANALGLTKATGFINVLEAGYTNKSETGSTRANGYEVELVLPIFDWGSARVAKAEALYLQSVHRTADTAIRARSQVREAYSAYRTSYDLAQHYSKEIVPLRKQISEEILLRYNGMLASVFELLADAREQVRSVNAAIEAQRDFWVAETNLQAAIHSGSVGNTAMTSRTSAPATASAAPH